jgi:LPXTG-motif cell wall-anchored protein
VSSGGGRSSGGGSSSSGGGDLPSTGPSDAVPFAAAGLAALVGGSALVFVARRRGNTPS